MSSVALCKMLVTRNFIAALTKHKTIPMSLYDIIIQV